MSHFSNRSYLRLCVAKICQDVGFSSIQSTPLEVLTDLLQDYMMALAKTAYNYALHCGNTEPNLNHLALAFKDMGVSISELQEYVRYVDSTAMFDCPKYPVSKESHLNLLKPGSREVVTRPFHIHEHLPPMHPHLEDQELAFMEESDQEALNESTSPIANSKSKVFKRPADSSFEGSLKRNRNFCEDEGRPLRELSSIMMTTSGFLSPAREGKLPEARTPVVRSDFAAVNQETNTTSSVPIVNELKVKKKLKQSPDHKKIEKETKAASEKDSESHVKVEEPIKPKAKKDVSKDSVKKSLKVSSLKSNLSLNNNSPFKSHKQANKISSSSLSILPLNPLSKSIKVKSPKNEKSSHSASKESNFASPLINQVSSEYKISSEPDKQKLNILKKISKVKEDLIDESVEKPVIDSSLARVDVTIESVIKREMVSIESPVPLVDVKEEVVDIETVQSPNPYQALITPPVEVTNETSPQVTQPLIVKMEKKKKKIKKTSKKELKQHPPESDFILPKPVKTIPETPQVAEPVEEMVMLPQEIQAPVQEVKEKHIPPVVIPVIPEFLKKEPESPIPNPQLFTENVQNQNQPIPSEPFPTNQPPIKSEDTETDLSLKKKIHKKEKKDKLKKKKKDKLKNKEKSEKRKLKLEKKVKDKEKQRTKKEKKERRKEKENEDVKTENPAAVPKITLKLGPASPTNSSDNNARKIVIIPVVKKEDVSRERAPSPELARFSPLVPNPKQKPIKNVAASEEPKTAVETTTVTELVEAPLLPPSVKLDKDGNEVWICPACDRQDDGSPMIGCDECDAWYHWVCVGIQVPPEVKNWYCNTCLNKKKLTDSEKKKRNKKKIPSKKGKIPSNAN